MAESIGVLFLAFVSVVVWLVRLEGRVNANEKSNDRTQEDVNQLRVKHEALDSGLVKELTQIKITLARIEGFMSTTKG